jgi:hypothetical protein
MSSWVNIGYIDARMYSVIAAGCGEASTVNARHPVPVDSASSSSAEPIPPA